MLRFASNEIGIVQGDSLIVSDFDAGGPMWTGDGVRMTRQHVTFEERFLTSPVVHLGIGMWDLDSDRNQRGDLRVENVTPSGFDLVFSTWGDTRVARLRVQWIAIGALPDEQDFVL
ncbi:MAG: H-type lectin domain-containing protein [Paracoccus sp. (in: a-proteobacteria)]|uniref:H-type lectin domain-containing protein n=1 Tax=Paracoccus sp. TaxID=267 RepID=UPI002E881D79|nr:H-type lectin domain-containing protein [Pseudomonadota bacterium]